MTRVSPAPAVSVVIAAKDVAPYIESAVRSALAQTVRDIEVIVVDDASCDDTLAKVSRMEDPRLTVLRADGRGWPRARNLAMQQVRGRLVAFLDGDDEYLPHHLARSLDALDMHPEWDLVFAAAEWIGEHGDHLPRTVVRWSGPIDFDHMFVEFPPLTCSSLVVRASAIRGARGFDEDLPTGADHDLCLRIMGLRSGNCAGIPEIGLRYRRRPNQITANLQRKADGWERLLEKHRGLSPGLVVPLASRARAAHFRALAALAYERSAFRDARVWMEKAMRESPASLLCDRRTWITGSAVASTFLPDVLRRPIERLGIAFLRTLRGERRK